MTFLISVSFKLVKESEKSKISNPPSLTLLFTTSLLILSLLQPYKQLISFFLFFGFWPIFAPRHQVSSIARLDQNHPQVVGTCPGYRPQLIGQTRVFKIKRRVKVYAWDRAGILNLRIPFSASHFRKKSKKHMVLKTTKFKSYESIAIHWTIMESANIIIFVTINYIIILR